MHQTLRPWFASGLLFLFADDFLPQDAASIHPASQDIQPQQPQYVPDAPPAHGVSIAPSGASRAQGRGGGAPQPSGNATPPPANAAASTVPQAVPSEAQDPSAATTWPTPWDAYWVKAGRFGARGFCITYMELGKNLGGHASPERSHFFNQLIARLAPLTGQTAFWPVAAFRTGSLHPDADQFMAGVRRLSAHSVLCFGLDAYRVLVPNAPAPRQPVTAHMVDGLTVYLLPQVDAILQKGAEGLDIIANALGQLILTHP